MLDSLRQTKEYEVVSRQKLSIAAEVRGFLRILKSSYDKQNPEDFYEASHSGSPTSPVFGIGGQCFNFVLPLKKMLKLTCR